MPFLPPFNPLTLLAWARNSAPAIAFAHERHLGQTRIGSSTPYFSHLAQTAAFCALAHRGDSSFDLDLAVTCAFLHDVCEDRGVAFDEIESLFGSKVRQIVQALSKNPALLKSEAMHDSLLRLRLAGAEACIVKMADRSSNLSSLPASWSAKKNASYAQEALLIHQELSCAHEPMAKLLSARIQRHQRMAFSSQNRKLATQSAVAKGGLGR